MARQKRCYGSEVASWERWKGSEVARLEAPSFIRGWGTEGESKVLSLCF